MPAASFVNNFVTVTQYKESEQGICGDYDMNRLDEYQISHMDRLNDESIAQEDLVAWVSLAAMHLPTSENWPMTNNLQHGLTISPYNFFDENPTMDMPNYHRMMSADDATLRGEADLPAVDTCIPPEQET